MKFRGLHLAEETSLGDDISEFWTAVDAKLLPGDSYYGSGSIRVQRKRWKILLRLARRNLQGLLREFPRLAVLTNDVSHNEERPLDFEVYGDLPPRVFKSCEHVTIHAGLWNPYFEKGPDVRNTLFAVEGRDSRHFLEHYLGAHLGNTQYRFLLGREEVDLVRAKGLIESAEDDDSFTAVLLEVADIVTYGSDETAYAFIMRDEGLKSEIRHLPRWKGH